MSDELDIKLGAPDGHAQFKHTLTRLIRSEAFAEADHFLGEQTHALHSEIGDICRKLPVDAVEITGWDQLLIEVETHSLKQAITAIGVDLSSHVENPKNPQGWMEPGLEVNYYSDKYYPFSSSSRSEILATSESGGTPWQGGFVDIDNVLEMRGLAHLHTLLRSQSINPMLPPAIVPAGFADVLIGTGYLLLRFHQALARDGQRNGLPRPMPLLAGEHDFSAFYIDSVYMIDRIADRHDEAGRILAEKEAEKWRKHAEATEEAIAELKEWRELSRNRRSHPHQLTYYETRTASRLSMYSIRPSRQTWQMGESEFAALIQQFRHARDPETPRPPLPKPQPEPTRRISPFGFGRKRN